MKTFFERSGIALLLSIPFFLIAHVAALISTPLWRKVEAWTGWELAGHSGPREEILVAFWIVGVVFAFILAFRRKKVGKTNGTMEASNP